MFYKIPLTKNVQISSFSSNYIERSALVYLVSMGLAKRAHLKCLRVIIAFQVVKHMCEA